MRYLAMILVIGAAAGMALGGCGLRPGGDAVAGQAATQAEDLPNFAQVSPALYRGAQPTAEGFKRLEQMGIKTVVNLRLPDNDVDLLKGTQLRGVHIPCDAWNVDEAKVAEFLKLACDPARQPVFVHCSKGADRTGLMVAVYRVTVQGWTREAALGELPRFGFHEIFFPLRWYVGAFDVEKVRRASATD